MLIVEGTLLLGQDTQDVRVWVPQTTWSRRMRERHMEGSWMQKDWPCAIMVYNITFLNETILVHNYMYLYAPIFTELIFDS